jgi:hypothetical protein
MLECFQILTMIYQILIVREAVSSPSTLGLSQKTTFAPAAPKAITSLSFANAVALPIPDVLPVKRLYLAVSSYFSCFNQY